MHADYDTDAFAVLSLVSLQCRAQLDTSTSSTGGLRSHSIFSLQAGYESTVIGTNRRQVSLPWPSAFLGVRCIKALERIRPFVVVQRHVYENMSHILGRHDVSVPYGIARGTLEYSMDLLSGSST
jgi:hypothetical protein